MFLNSQISIDEKEVWLIVDRKSIGVKGLHRAIKAFFLLLGECERATYVQLECI